MTDDTIPATPCGEIVFPRFGFARVAHADPSQRRYLLLAKYHRPEIVGLDRLEVHLNASGRCETLNAYLLKRSDGERDLAIVDERLEAILASAATRPCSITLRVDGTFHLPCSSTRIVTFADIPDCARSRDAEAIERRGSRDGGGDPIRAAYQALFVDCVGSVEELQAALPKGVDALAVAMRLAWLGEIAFIGTGISCRSRFAHTPVDAKEIDPHAWVRTRRHGTTANRGRAGNPEASVIVGADAADHPVGVPA